MITGMSTSQWSMITSTAMTSITSMRTHLPILLANLTPTNTNTRAWSMRIRIILTSTTGMNTDEWTADFYHREMENIEFQGRPFSSLRVLCALCG
jgi:hypothetical protein